MKPDIVHLDLDVNTSHINLDSDFVGILCTVYTNEYIYICDVNNTVILHKLLDSKVALCTFLVQIALDLGIYKSSCLLGQDCIYIYMLTYQSYMYWNLWGATSCGQNISRCLTKLYAKCCREKPICIPNTEI